MSLAADLAGSWRTKAQPSQRGTCQPGIRHGAVPVNGHYRIGPRPSSHKTSSKLTAGPVRRLRPCHDLVQRSGRLRRAGSSSRRGRQFCRRWHVCEAKHRRAAFWPATWRCRESLRLAESAIRDGVGSYLCVSAGLGLGAALAVSVQCIISEGTVLRVFQQVNPQGQVRPLKFRAAGDYRDTLRCGASSPPWR